MAAGLGFKNFTSGEVLTAADVNGYLNSQTVMVFADAAARTAAITSPQEGMISYLKDTNATQYYSGSAWVAVATASPLTTKGDLYTYSTTDARLGVGANNTVLTADSTAATGLKWASAAPAGANWSLLNTGGTSLSGTTTTVSGISGVDKIMVLVQTASTGTGPIFYVRFNADSTGNYGYAGVVNQYGGTYSGFNFNPDDALTATQFRLSKTPGDGNSGGGYVLATGCNSAGLKQVLYGGGANGGTNQQYFGAGFYAGTSTISSISITTSDSSTFDGGTVYVYTSA